MTKYLTDSFLIQQKNPKEQPKRKNSDEEKQWEYQAVAQLQKIWE